jgi:hypothetical protein
VTCVSDHAKPFQALTSVELTATQLVELAQEILCGKPAPPEPGSIDHTLPFQLSNRLPHWVYPVPTAIQSIELVQDTLARTLSPESALGSMFQRLPFQLSIRGVSWPVLVSKYDPTATQ